MKILNIGSCNIDYVYNVEHIVTARDTFAGYFVSIASSNNDYAQAIKTASAGFCTFSFQNGCSTIKSCNFGCGESFGNFNSRTYSESKKDMEKRKILNYIDENITGASFSKLLQKRRCKTAADMLKGTSVPISDIIRKTGYENETFFRNKFKEFYGMSPLAYRKNKQREEVSLNDK